MIEYLAIPGWQTGPTTLEAWVARLGEISGVSVTVKREPPQGAWIILNGLQTRGFAILVGADVEAINFEVAASDLSKTLALLEEAAASLNWELHPDEGDDEDEEE